MTRIENHSPREADRERELSSVAVDVLEQSKTLLTSLPDGLSFVKESVYVPKSNIAKHVRHIIDHYRLLFASRLETSHTENVAWVVDYDSRERNIAMETNKDVAIQEIERIQAIILNANIPLSTPVQLRALVSCASEEESEFESNYGRELWFCVHHTIHHHALIKAICIEHGIGIPDSFGLAPSTQKYYQKP
ncbi:hypothetical protein K493DRAFT_312766 [Basidiobolus meristosporus CBS 931.73]|uniref:DinB-like domain-containing protein n=1 Tax=Basidiobolus meristosporus CBS 931.73 TaxID=1314790 RepID=A0A1Y1YS41_9FUNG|nr:hypothetical protein K493DRAFT_312766 [Basidiobolus meristosporus CBS 931.73]|eukprot:ORY00634.1 hypothetical protein K493DRAFT_312766 [Basidiobolus meristosporus CBS 931.73]